jgi:hypothetical protein
MTPNAYDKLNASRQHWRKTVGEHVLRTAGVGLAVIALSVGVWYGLYYGWQPGGPEPPYRVDRAHASSPARVLLIASELDDSADGFAEAIRSYFGARVTLVAQTDLAADALSGSDCVIVFSNVAVEGTDERRALLTSAVEKQVPIYWIGGGVTEVASVLGLPSFDEEAERALPMNSLLTYKGADVDAEGLPFIPGYPADAEADVEVIAAVRLHDAFVRPAAVRSPRATYLAFSPFPRSGPPLALAIAIGLLSDTLGRHEPNPRVVIRLEDVNAVDYGPGDTSFSRTAKRFTDTGMFVHVAITPVMVDATGTLAADISGAQGVLDFLAQHPSQSAVVQHGTRHHRDDPRNAGKASGDAYEFFFDDDETMGKQEAMRFALARLTEGREAMAKAGFFPLMFEAPHLEMSPGEEASARHLFPVMMHPPLFFGRSSGHFSVWAPWITERDGTVYAPSDVGYVDALDEGSVNAILGRLDQLRTILPDPIAVVFYHPFMIDKPGREGDLSALIDGIRHLGYRSVGLLNEVETER